MTFCSEIRRDENRNNGEGHDKIQQGKRKGQTVILPFQMAFPRK